MPADTSCGAMLPSRPPGAHCAKSRLHGCCIALLAVLAYPPAIAADFSIQMVAEGNYVHRGAHVGIEEPGNEDIANIGFIIGRDCVAVIDTGGSIALGRQLHAALRGITDLPVCTVINTHEHYDHVLGNAAFAGDSPEFMGHAELAAALEASTPLFIEQFGSALGDPPDPAAVIAPTRTVTDSVTVDLGERTLEIRAWRTGHSQTDVTVLDLKTGTLWLGDLVFIDRVPALEGSLQGWITVLEELRALSFELVVPGHGPASAPWPGGSDATLAYLESLRAEVRQFISEGRSLDEAIAAAGTDKPGAWLLFDRRHGRNVSKAYTELEWE